MSFDRAVFFDWIRDDPFGGALTQGQVDGMERLLATWETYFACPDRRWLAYCMATSFHETGGKMTPVEEIGKGAGKPYGVADPTTGQTYYGRGDIQCTWRENYARLDKEFGLKGDESCEWHAANALDPMISARALFQGMIEGWYRAGHNLPRYFSDTVNDPYTAREIVNGDKHIVPSWSNGVSIGNLIKEYHIGFLTALDQAYDPPSTAKDLVVINVRVPAGIRVEVHVEEDS